MRATGIDHFDPSLKIFPLKKYVFLNGLLTQCALLSLPCFLILLFP